MRRLLPGVVLIGVLFASPAVAEKPRVVVLDFTSSSDKLKRTASSVAEQTLTELSRSKTVEVLGASDVTALLGMERQRQLLGCTENSSSCLAEITAAMGAPWLVMGNLAQLGKVTRIDIKLIRASDGKAVVREGKNLSDESEIFEFVNTVVPRMLEWMQPKAESAAKPEPKVNPAKVEPAKVEPAKVEPAKVIEPPQPRPEAPPVEVASAPEAAVEAVASPPGSAAPWVLIVGGGAAVLGGGVVLMLGIGLREPVRTELSRQLVQPQENLPTYSEARRQLEIANTFLTTGGIIAGVGAVALGSGLVWKLGEKRGSPGATVTLIPGVGALTVRGEF